MCLCQLLLKMNVAVSNPKAKTTLVTARISLFHRLLCWKLDCYDTMEKTQKNKYLKNLKIWNMGPQDLTSFVAYLPGFYNYFGLSDCLYLTFFEIRVLVAAEALKFKGITGPAEQFLKRGGRWPPLLNWGARRGGTNFAVLSLFSLSCSVEQSSKNLNKKNSIPHRCRQFTTASLHVWKRRSLGLGAVL